MTTVWLWVEYGIILRTTNGGTTWTQQTSEATEWLCGVSFADLDNGTAVGGNLLLPSYGIILRTTNGGTNWTLQTSEQPLILSALQTQIMELLWGNELFTLDYYFTND